MFLFCHSLKNSAKIMELHWFSKNVFLKNGYKPKYLVRSWECLTKDGEPQIFKKCGLTCFLLIQLLLKQNTIGFQKDIYRFISGLFCWLITNCPQDRGIDYTETIRNCIKQDVDVQRCLKEIEDGKYKKLEESQAMFSVISKVDFKKTDQIQSPVFSIKNCPGSEAMPLKVS